MCIDNCAVFRFPSFHLFFPIFVAEAHTQHIFHRQLESTTSRQRFVVECMRSVALSMQSGWKACSSERERKEAKRDREWAACFATTVSSQFVYSMLFVRNIVCCVSLQTRWLNIEGSMSLLEVSGMHLRLRIFTFCLPKNHLFVERCWRCIVFHDALNKLYLFRFWIRSKFWALQSKT